MRTKPNGCYRGYVYLAEATNRYHPDVELHIYKIGCTRRQPTKRFPSNGYENGYYHKLVCFGVVENMHLLEKYLHNVFYLQRACRLADREYFYLSEENIIYISEMFEKTIDNFNKKFDMVTQ